MIQDFSTAVVELKHFPYPEDFDEDCRFACDFFNSVGLTTKYSFVVGMELTNFVLSLMIRLKVI